MSTTAAAPAAAAKRVFPDGWWIHVYDTTQATDLVFQSGPSRQDNTVWGGWARGHPSPTIPLPEGQQALARVFVQISSDWSNPGNQDKQVDAAVLFNGVLRQQYHFDGPHEWHEIERGGAADEQSRAAIW